jgi:hypothetical protein
LLELVASHRTALDAFVADDQTRHRLVASTEFLTDSLSTFEMAQRGYAGACLEDCDADVCGEVPVGVEALGGGSRKVKRARLARCWGSA